MSKQANPTLIGAFVTGAVALLAVAVLLFGGSEYFKPKARYVAYFPESVKGLRVGADVLFRGVRIGFVEQIQLQGDASTLETWVQVVMQVFPDQFQLTDGGIPVDGRSDEFYSGEDLIAAGMRAQLGVESYVTGLLLVEVDFQPELEGNRRGGRTPYPEIPTIRNNIEQLVENVRTFLTDLQAQIDPEELARNLQGAIRGIHELVNSPDLRESLAGVNRLVNAAETQQLSVRITDTLTDARETLADTRQFVNNADRQLAALVADLGPVVTRLDTTLAAAESALAGAAAQVSGDTELMLRLNATLEEIQGASRALRLFLDYVERNPDALLRGKRSQ